IDSTNTECKRQAMAGAEEGLVVTAEEQTGGRGRRGRGFQSPRGKGLYLSALFRPELEPSKVSDFTAWVAVAVCDGVEACCGVRPKIKWTNDIILNGKKLVGILTELGLESESNTLDYLVTGIGVNVNQGTEDFSPEIRDMAISLAQALERPVRRAELAAQIILALDRMYAAYPQGRAEYLEKYRADCITPGHQVQLITSTSRRQAFALEIDENFNLVVELHNGKKETISAGEVSVRGMYGYV
ncbi:MAG: biotin--[acetyl-CoA-carboxylase] ligase, partial [Lawsonibacter sp.]|nr:biotin--[acetyl-CoA-carboxylase] ligase [Lawsonibacter sp.]